ncbi:MAG: hypothetical protein HY279_08445, partial [Nitrospinae bacterium]|nr:hypothetical protein [Nitrospinota bacterium]
AFDDQVRKKMLRRKMDRKVIEDAFRIIKKYKINIYNNNMIALPFTSLEQDIDSLDFIIKLQPEMPDFTIFMPYHGTDLGDYCREAGIHDVETESMAGHGLKILSPLTCFSEKEKRGQYNLCQLGIVAVKFPYLRNLIVNHLIYWKPNKLFFLLNYFFSMKSYGEKIFYYKHSFTEYIKLVIITLKHSIYDVTKKREDKSVKYSKNYEKEKEKGFDFGQRLKGLEICMKEMAQTSIYLSPSKKVEEKMVFKRPTNHTSTKNDSGKS